MCVNPMTIKVNDEWRVVPCGKCMECMADKQNDTAILCVREAEKRGTMEFITLTYSNDSIPMYFNVCDISHDEETGHEYLITYGEPTRVSQDLEEGYRKSYFKYDKSRLCDECDFVYGATDEEGNTKMFCITPSLCRKDIQDWIKRCRRNYEYTHSGETLDFSYIVAGEYGPNTFRPHWHLCFFGLTHEQALEFCSDWREKKGFYTCSSVEPIDREGKNHYEAAGKYVGKYISKPQELENTAVMEKRAEKPRRQTSIGFGYKNDEEALTRYHLCYDLVGEYDPDDVFGTIDTLTYEQYETLMKEIIRRKKYYLNGKDYKLPRKISRQLFYRKQTLTDSATGEIKRKESSTQIQRMVSAFVRNNLNKDFNEQLAALKMQYGDEVPFEKIRELIHMQNADRQSRAQAAYANMLKKYSKSYF